MQGRVGKGLGLLAFTGIFWASPTLARPYQVGVYIGLGGTQDVQGTEILRTISKVFSAKLKISTQFQVYTDESKFRADIRSKKLDMTFTTRWDVFFGTVLKHGFRPSVTLKNFGENKVPNCLYVLTDSPFQKVQDLKGRRVTTYTSQTEYFSFRQFLGTAPEKYFTPLATFPNSLSGLYQLSLGTTEAAFVNRGVFRFLNLTNPGVAKQLRPVACSPGYYSPPFSMGPRVDKQKEFQIAKIIRNIPNDPAFAHFRPLSKGLKASFITVTKDNYLPMINLRKKAFSLNWHLDHQKWLENVQVLREKIRTDN